jgi:hypothetical protein
MISPFTHTHTHTTYALVQVLLRGMMKNREEIRSRAVANPETQDVFLGERGIETSISMDRMIHLVCRVIAASCVMELVVCLSGC